MRHELKTWPEYFQAVWDKQKTFEVRKNDRDFRVGDDLVLREYNPETQEYTGSAIVKKVSYTLNDPQFVKEGFIVMGLGDYRPKAIGTTAPLNTEGVEAVSGLTKEEQRC